MFGFLLAELALSVVVGVVAQRWKKRTGAAWAVIALAVQMAVLAFAVYSITTHSPQEFDRPEVQIVMHLFTLAAGLVMFGVVATLPRR